MKVTDADLIDLIDQYRWRESAFPYHAKVYSLLCEVRSSRRELAALRDQNAGLRAGPIPMILFCPRCSVSHIDEGGWATKSHKTHLCATCGFTWMPCAMPTVGVAAIDSFGPIDTALGAPHGND
jgi:hypothetical protein